MTEHEFNENQAVALNELQKFFEEKTAEISDKVIDTCMNKQFEIDELKKKLSENEEIIAEHDRILSSYSGCNTMQDVVTWLAQQATNNQLKCKEYEQQLTEALGKNAMQQNEVNSLKEQNETLHKRLNALYEATSFTAFSPTTTSTLIKQIASNLVGFLESTGMQIPTDLVDAFTDQYIAAIAAKRQK